MLDRKLEQNNGGGIQLGPELADSFAFTLWVPFGVNLVIADGGETKITYVNSASGARLPLNSAGALTADLVVGNSYRVKIGLRINTGSASVLANNGAAGNTVVNFSNTTSIEQQLSFVATSTTDCDILFANMGGTDIVWVSGLSVKQVL